MKNLFKQLSVAFVLIIIVQSQGQTIKLTSSDVDYLNRVARSSVGTTLDNYKKGGTIKNNDVADNIITLLKHRK